jgi:hypothetical protein
LILALGDRVRRTRVFDQLPRLLRPDFTLATLDCQGPAVTEGLQRRRVTVEPLARTALESSPFAVFGEWLEATEESQILQPLATFPTSTYGESY